MTSILIIYHSQEFGNTKAMAEAVAEGAKNVGAKVTLINTNEQRVDIDHFREFDVTAIGTPDYYSYLAGNLKQFVDDCYIAKKTNRKGLENKPYGLFYSHGGGGSVRKPFEDLIRSMRLGEKIGKTIESYGRPNDGVLEECRELGKQIVEKGQIR